MVPQLAPPPAAGRFTLSRLRATPPGRLLLAWLVLRTAVWTLAVALSHKNPPLDLVEWLSWGGSWEWGYPKHPPLPAWVADAAHWAAGGVWGVYLVSYAFVASCLGAAYLVGRDYLPPRAALVAALALDGLVFLTHDAAEYSNNVVLDAGWAWTIFCFHRAFRSGRLHWWLAIGVVVGLTLLVKYTVGVLLLAVAGYAVATPAGRRCLRTPGPYLAAVVAAAVAAPHFVWLAAHDFITLTYAAERSVDDRGLLRHLLNPLVFLAGEAGLLLPVLHVVRPLFRTRGEPPAADPKFLHAAVLGPVAVLVGLSLTTGCQLRQIWASPLWTFLPVWVLVAFRAGVDDAALRTAARRWMLVAAGFLLFTVAKQTLDPYVTGVPGRQAFPGKDLADEIGRRWAAQHPEPFAIAAGDGWSAGNVCVFAPQRPILYSSGSMGYLVMDHEHCPWTSDADLNRRGGVIVWDAAKDGDTLAELLRDRFPRMTVQPPVLLEAKTGAKTAPVRIGLAFVPPAP